MPCRNMIRSLTGEDMNSEPEIFCPKCGAKAAVIIWFSDEPGEGFGSANCLRCGGIDYTVKRGKVIKTEMADADGMAYSEDDLLSNEDYDRELTEYLLEQGLV